MNQIKLVLDSSANLTELEGIPLGVSPLKIVTDEKTYIDDASLDPERMASHLRKYRGTSTTSCPNAEDWLEAFGEGNDILCITITSGLSGTYNTARLAKEHINDYNRNATPYKKIGILKVRTEEFPKNTLRKILRFRLDMSID